MTGNETVNLFIFKGLNKEIKDMAKNSKIAGLVLGSIFAATALTAANDAMALEAGQCLPMAQMNEAMISEGQRTLIIGNRVAVNNSTTSSTGLVVNKWMNAVTSNADGSLGYQIEGNKPRGEISTEVCVAAKLTNTQLFDATKNEIPQAALLGGAFNRAMELSAEDGIRPMVVADTVFGQGSNLRNGAPLVLIGDPTRKIGSITTIKNGEAVSLAGLQNVEYTPVALQRLAANSSNITLAGLNK